MRDRALEFHRVMFDARNVKLESYFNAGYGLSLLRLRRNGGGGGYNTGATYLCSTNTHNTGLVNYNLATENRAYSFTLDVLDVDVGSTLTYSIQNKPNWATFDTTTGELSGTPTNSEVGTYANIIISVTDDVNVTVSLSSFDLVVQNVNSAPTASNITLTSTEDENATFILNDFNFADIDVGDSVEGIVITTLPSKGTLQLNNVNVILNQNIAVADLSNLKFVPGANGNGDAYSIFSFKANDGDSNSILAYTATINVTAVNDAPVILSNLVVENAGFESSTVAGNWEYVVGNSTKILDNWKFSASQNGVGLTKGVSSPWVSSVPEGNNAAFIQRNGELSQEINFLSTGDYIISYKAVGRTDYAVQSLIVNMDDDIITTLSGHSNSAWGEYTTTYTCTVAGLHTLKFKGQGSGDYATSIDDISVMKVGAENDDVTTTVSMMENTTIATTVVSSDVDGDAITYNLTGGSDQAKFSINSAGVLTFITAPNYEVMTDSDLDNTYVVEVTVTDDGAGSLTNTRTIMVSVTDANGFPFCWEAMARREIKADPTVLD